ncbi:MAG: Fic family protein [Bacteroidetes bacterium]|nr:Fic family protein [Bacteroidota bacterium]
MIKYIHQLPNWPAFTWNQETLTPLLMRLRLQQGKLLGKMESLGFELKAEANLETLTQDVIKSSEIEGEVLDEQQVRSSIARKLGMEIVGLVHSDRHVDGVVEMMLDATQNYKTELTKNRLFGWHAALFPTGYSGMSKIEVGGWRNNTANDPMQVVSGAMGKLKVHYEAPASELLEKQMELFIIWFNKPGLDRLLKAAIAHLWFVTLHPLEDGNGRMARAIADMQLAKADETSFRFYSMSAQIRKERADYYFILEQTQKSSLDITVWLQWFLGCLERTYETTETTLKTVLNKADFWKKNTAILLNKRQHIIINKLLDGFDGKLNTSKYAKITKCSRDTALRDVTDLISKNILTKEEGQGKNTAYILR